MIYKGRPSAAGTVTAERPQAPLATEKQVSFVLRLESERDGVPQHTEAALAVMERRTISALIDGLLAVPRTAAKPGTAKKSPGVDDGFYLFDGQYVKVVWNQAQTRKYALVYDGTHWDYESAKGVYAKLTPAMVLTAEQAAAFGALYGKCVYCHRKLTDDRSIEVGYGRDCAEQRGLPWG